MMRKRQAGQSTAEYAIVLGVVIAALVGMQIYVKRGLNAKVKTITDHLSAEVGTAGAGALTKLEQYEPYYTSSNYKVAQHNKADKDYNAGQVVRNVTLDETTRKGSSTTGVALDADDNWQPD